MNWFAHLREALALLRQSDSDRGKHAALSKAIMEMVQADDGYAWPYVLDVFDTHVIYEHNGSLYRIDYTYQADESGKKVPAITLGSPELVEVAYVPLRKQEAGALTEAQQRALAEVKPKDGESKDDFIDRCMGALAKEFPERDQRFAVCNSEWRAKSKEAAVGVELRGDLVELREAAVDPNGEIRLKIIQPGWGSSGYYPAHVLERDGPQVFPAQTKMFWDHQTKAEEAAQPEGSLTKLAAELTTPAQWQADGPQGPGLYARAKTFGPYKEAIDELQPHIGVSIRAMGSSTAGQAEGRSGQIIEKLLTGKSVDFVTVPGAGGQILSLFESVGGAPPLPTPKQEEATVTPEEAKQLQESNASLTQQLAAMRRELNETAAARIAAQTVAAHGDLPAPVRARVVERLTGQSVPLTEAGLVDEATVKANVEAAITAEMTYARTLAESLGATGIRGMGASTGGSEPPTREATMKRLDEAWAEFGLSDSTRKHAVAGRQ